MRSAWRATSTVDDSDLPAWLHNRPRSPGGRSLHTRALGDGAVAQPPERMVLG